MLLKDITADRLEMCPERDKSKLTCSKYFLAFESTYILTSLSLYFDSFLWQGHTLDIYHEDKNVMARDENQLKTAPTLS
jgi:hypothetical protein